jgi:1-acyl-sn-glycerol-3-phosphate acyltransferase
VFYWFIKAMFWPLGKIYFRTRRRGAHNVPRSGAAIVVANHASFLDPAILGDACPRKVHFLIMRAMYDLRRFRWFYVGMESIPVSADPQDALSLRRALRALRQGQVVGVFPEGHRRPDGSLGEGRLGAALLAARSGAPVIPVGIRGAYEAMPAKGIFPWPKRIETVFGPPLRWEGGKPGRAALAAFSERLMSAVGALAREEG